MKNIKWLCVAVTLFFVTANGFCDEINYLEDTNAPVSYKHSIGMSAGVTAGTGITYRYMPKDLGLQIALTPIYVSSTGFAWINLGVTGLLKIYENNYSRYFLYAAVSGLYNQSFYTNYGNGYYTNSSAITVTSNLSMTVALGLGNGLEFCLGNFSLNIMYGIGLFYKPYNLAGQQFNVGLTGEAAFFYRFN